MSELSVQIDSVLKELLLQAENQHELLIGACESEIALTNTQEHILMMIAEQAMTNTELARHLKISQAAVTKAVKGLITRDLLVAVRDEKDARVIRYALTAQAQPIASEHRHHHDKTLLAYEELLAAYTAEEQATIARFLKELLGRVRQG